MMKTYQMWLVAILATYDDYNFNRETIDLVFAIL